MEPYFAMQEKVMGKGFRMMMKQRGGMLAKGRLLGVQFFAMFRDGLYGEIGSHADGEAMRIKKALKEKKISLYYESTTNQQFFVLSRDQIARLRQYAAFETWAPLAGDRVAVRFVTSWATTDAMLDELETYL